LKTCSYNCGRTFGRNYNLKAVLGLDYTLIFRYDLHNYIRTSKAWDLFKNCFGTKIITLGNAIPYTSEYEK